MRHNSMYRLSVVVIALALAALACNLGGGSDGDNPSPAPVGTATITPPVQITPSQQFVIVTNTPTATGVAVPNPTGIPPTQVNCTPQSGWPVYTVVAGDTLSQIAARTGTTTAQIVTANCLTNSELIYVGQKLYVPALPPTSTPIPTQNPDLPIFSANLTVQPFWLDSSNRPVTYSATVRVNAGEVLNAATVDFYVNDPNSASAIFIGQDADPWDGAFVDYDIPFAGSYTFQAVASNEQGSAKSTQFSLRYDPDFVPPGGQPNQLTVTPILRRDGGFIVLQSNSTVMIRWPDAPVGATRIDFLLTPTGTGMGDAAQTIGSDLDATDGAAISWAVLAGITAHMQAVASMPDGSTQVSELLGIASEAQ